MNSSNNTNSSCESTSPRSNRQKNTNLVSILNTEVIVQNYITKKKEKINYNFHSVNSDVIRKYS
jgi:hypothetical protein